MFYAFSDISDSLRLTAKSKCERSLLLVLSLCPYSSINMLLDWLALYNKQRVEQIQNKAYPQTLQGIKSIVKVNPLTQQIKSINLLKVDTETLQEIKSTLEHMWTMCKETVEHSNNDVTQNWKDAVKTLCDNNTEGTFKYFFSSLSVVSFVLFDT